MTTAVRKRKMERIAAQRVIDKNRPLAKADWVRTPRASVVHNAKLIVHYSAQVDALEAERDDADAGRANLRAGIDTIKAERDEQKRIRLLADDAIRRLDKLRADLKAERDEAIACLLDIHPTRRAERTNAFLAKQGNA